MEREDGRLGSLLHKCTGTAGCEFCQLWRRHSIELGWETLWDDCDLPANFVLSTQQTIDFQADADLDEFDRFSCAIKSAVTDRANTYRC